MRIFVATIILFIGLTLPIFGGQEMSMQEAIDMVRNVPAMPDTSTQMSMQEAIDLGRSLSYQTGVAMQEYPTQGRQYTMQEAIDYSGYRVQQAWPVYYQPQMQQFYPQYAVMYPQQNVAAWLFGTPRQRSIPAELVAEPTSLSEPTPQPVATEATQPVITQPAIMQAGIIAASVIVPQTRTVEENETATDAIPEMTMLDMLNYWTRKILLTGVLLSIGAFAWYKEHTARHQASRRLADLEQDMHRLDRLIYGDDRKGGDTP